MKKLRFHILLLVFAQISGMTVMAQQQAIYSQFIMDKYLYNPAAAGSDRISSVKLIGHDQWAGFEGAPNYFTATFDSRIFKPDHRPIIPVRKKERKRIINPGSIGVGGQIYNEHNGPLSLTGLNATYSYHMSLGEAQLSFGLSLVISNFNLNTSEIILSDGQFDNLTDGGKSNRWITDFNFGTMLSAPKYYAGYSTTQVLGSSLQFGESDGSEFKIKRMHYIMGGYRYEINENLALEPSTLLKIPEGSKAQLDLNVKATIKENYWCGLIFRTGSALAIFGGLNYDRYFIGYSFEYNLNLIRKYSYGSHEIILGVQLGETIKRYRWLNNY